MSAVKPSGGPSEVAVPTKARVGGSPEDTVMETYRELVGFIHDFGYPPTLAQLGRRLGLSSKSSVFERLQALEAAGLIERVPGSPRAIIIKEDL